MSILPQNHTDEVALLDCVQRFFSKHHVGKLLKQCNGTKEKGVSAVSLLNPHARTLGTTINETMQVIGY